MNTLDSINPQRVCRICLQITKESLNIFDDNEECKNLLDKIYLCFQIMLNYEKDLPHKICMNCVKDLNAANNFRMKCVTFHDRFNNLFRDTHTNTVNVQDLVIKYNNDAVNSNLHDDLNTLDIEGNGSSETESHDDLHFKCNMCSKVLKTKESLSKHIILMHQNRKHLSKVTGYGPTRRYHCTICPYSTPHSQTLVNHLRKHDGERPYRCECGKSFTQSSSLAAHQKSHSDTTYFTCSTCGKQFKHAYSLKKHLLVHENGNLNCNICHKILKSKQSLQDHMCRHYNIRNFNCEECGNTFVTSSELISHRKKHSKDKRVECSLCGYKTHTKKNLIIHLKRHTGDKSFKCDLCDVTFYTQGDVTRHRRVHTREKPFSCPTCSQKFTYSTSLNKHMSTVHGVDYKWGEFKKKELQKKCDVKVDSGYI